MPTSFLISNIDPSLPTDLLPASQLCAEIRALKLTLRGLLQTAFADNMTLKPKTIEMSSFSDASVGAAQIADNSILNRHLTTGCIGSPNIQDESIFEQHLADNAVSNSKIKPGTITNNRLAPSTIESDRIKSGAITTNLIADSAVTDAKIAGVSGAKITDGTIKGTAFKPDIAYSTPRVPVVTATASAYASIGGDIAATYDAGTGVLRLVYQPTAANRGTVAVFRQTNSGATSAAYAATTRNGFSIVHGNQTIGEIQDPKLRIKVAGVYLVFFVAAGYSCGAFRCALVAADDNSIVVPGTVGYAGIGQGGVSIGHGVIEVAEDSNNQFKLNHYAELANSTNGQGLLTGSNDVTATVTFIQLG